MDSSNYKFYTVSDSGILILATQQKNNVTFDLRLHRTTYRESSRVDCEQPSERRICWFFNAERSPAPGFVVVMYLGATHNVRPHELSLKALTSTTELTSKVKEKASHISDDDDDDDEWQPAAKRRWLSYWICSYCT